MPLLYENKSDDHKHQMLRWLKVREYVHRHFDKRPDLNAILFLIGLNELGQIREKWSKEEKQDLMHLAICALFEDDGYFELETFDQDGWPHYIATAKLPKTKLRDQEDLLKKKIIQYFEEKDLIPKE